MIGIGFRGPLLRKPQNGNYLGPYINRLLQERQGGSTKGMHMYL